MRMTTLHGNHLRRPEMNELDHEKMRSPQLLLNQLFKEQRLSSLLSTKHHLQYHPDYNHHGVTQEEMWMNRRNESGTSVCHDPNINIISQTSRSTLPKDHLVPSSGALLSRGSSGCHHDDNEEQQESLEEQESGAHVSSSLSQSSSHYPHQQNRHHHPHHIHKQHNDNQASHHHENQHPLIRNQLHNHDHTSSPQERKKRRSREAVTVSSFSSSSCRFHLMFPLLLVLSLSTSSTFATVKYDWVITMTIIQSLLS